MKSNNQSEIITQEYLKNKINAGKIFLILFVGFFIGSGIGSAVYSDNDNGAIQVSIIYSSEKEGWMEMMNAEFLAQWENIAAANPDLPKNIKLDLIPYGSGSSLIGILNKEIQPVIWSPASNVWIPILNDKWQDIRDTNEIIAPNYTRIVYSPIVMATWDGGVLDQNNVEGINDLHDLIQNDTTNVKLAHTDPRSSNSGFMATIMLLCAKLGVEPTNITLDHMKNEENQEWMRVVESAAVQYGESTGFLGRYMRDSGPDALDVAFVYENLIKEYTLEAEENFGSKLKAIYPVEGSLFSDHPFCVLDSDWVDEDQRLVANEFIKFINQSQMIAMAIDTGFRPIDQTLLEDDDIGLIYNATFTDYYGISNNQTMISERELLPPDNGNVLSRVPDLWLITRNTA